VTRAVYEPVTDISSTTTPMAQLPAAAGEVVSVLQSRLAGVLIQRIVLRGDPQTGGENQIVVRVDQNERRPGDIDGPVPKPTRTIIAAELDENFPAIDMRMSQTWNRNSFGPFGYAIGHAPGNVTCIYAWQWSAGRPPRIIDDPAAVESAGSMPSAPTSVRVRLCKSSIDETEIVAMLRDLAVSPPGSTTPYVDPSYEATGPLGAHDALAAAGVTGGWFPATKAAVSHDPDSRRERRPRHAHARHRREEIGRDFAPSIGPASAGVNVPLPPGGATATNPASNPLLAPLQASAPPRPAASAAGDEMPLPNHPSAARAANPPSGSPGFAPIPLPN
jgi:hypothetical protein